jgi:hypothetical protein
MQIKISITLAPHERRDNTKICFVIKRFKSLCAKNGIYFDKELKPVPGFSRTYELHFLRSNEQNQTDKTKVEEQRL